MSRDPYRKAARERPEPVGFPQVPPVLGKPQRLPPALDPEVTTFEAVVRRDRAMALGGIVAVAIAIAAALLMAATVR